MEKETIPDKFYRISIKALILDEDKRFMLTLEDNGLWELPGGGLEFGENPHNCLRREIQEEMRLEVTWINDQPSYFVTALHRGGKKWIANVIYEVRVKDLKFTPSNECVELRFFTKEEAIKENLFSNVTEFIKIFNPESHA